MAMSLIYRVLLPVKSKQREELQSQNLYKEQNFAHKRQNMK